LKWINAGDLDRAEEIIAIGKESTVLHGVCDAKQVGTSAQDESEEQHFAIKIYKQSLNAFRNRGEYLSENDAFRFKNPRSVLKVWSEREFIHLQRLRRHDIPCPIPLKLKKHVMLMSLIMDSNGRPASNLKHVEWVDEAEKVVVFAQVKDIMIRMFKDAHMVHADFSEFNLLYDANGKVYVIDVAQAVDLSHPNALVYLARDVENILAYFDKCATEGLPNSHTLFTEITGIELEDLGKDLIGQVESIEIPTNSGMFRNKTANYELVQKSRELEEEDSDSDVE